MKRYGGLGIERWRYIMNACCIILSNAKLYQGLALYYSLIPNMTNYKVFFLCVGDEVYELLIKMNLENAVIIPVNAVEDEVMLTLKAQRSVSEYCYTLKPIFLLYILNNYPSINIVTYTDADLFFYSNAMPIYNALDHCSVLLSTHELPTKLSYYESLVGRYNAGFLILKRDKTAYECLEWWRLRCMESCSDKPKNGIFTDQKYLDRMSTFNGVSVIMTPGVNIAPWNIYKYDFANVNGTVTVNNKNLIFFHFSGFRVLSKKEYVFLNGPFLKLNQIMDTYINKISNIISVINNIDPNFDGAYLEDHHKSILTSQKIEKFKPDINIIGDSFMRKSFKTSPVSRNTQVTQRKKYITIYHLLTVVSSSHLFKAIVMHDSLERHFTDYHHFILCADDNSYTILSSMNWKATTLIKLSDIEDDTLKRIKEIRLESEYCWTLKPALILYVMDKFPKAKYYVYLDADLFFSSSLDKIVSESLNSSVFLSHHNHSYRFQKAYICGIYNSGFILWEYTPQTYKLIKWWRDRCIEWCNIGVDEVNKRFADQRYLEQWHKYIDNIHVIKNLGANTAPWNIDKYKLSVRSEMLYVNNDKLIFYHFSSLSIYNSKEFNLSSFFKLREDVVQLIYLPYLTLLNEAIEKVQKAFPLFTEGFTLRGTVQEAHYYYL